MLRNPWDQFQSSFNFNLKDWGSELRVGCQHMPVAYYTTAEKASVNKFLIAITTRRKLNKSVPWYFRYNI